MRPYAKVLAWDDPERWYPIKVPLEDFSMRLPVKFLQRIRQYAKVRGYPWQTILRTWLMERATKEGVMDSEGKYVRLYITADRAVRSAVWERCRLSGKGRQQCLSDILFGKEPPLTVEEVAPWADFLEPDEGQPADEVLEQSRQAKGE